MIRHTIRNESEEFAKKVGVGSEPEAALTPDGLRAHREAYVAAIRAAAASGTTRTPTWTWRSSSGTAPST